VLGALLWLPFIQQLASLAELVSPAAANLEGAERLAAEVPRQIANAATLWATANVLLFLPFTALFARMAKKIVPERIAVERAIIGPKYLDEKLIRIPSMALERARLELGHMAELTEAMLGRVKAAFVRGDFTDLSQQNDQVVVLRDAVLGYLQRVGRGQLSDAESDEHARLVAATGDIENMSAAISRELAPLAKTRKESGITPSDETRALLESLFETIREASQSALKALVDRDERAAQAVVACRDAIWNLTSELHRQQAARLAQDDPERLLKHRVQVDILDKLNRVYSVAEHMAISVLPRGVLAAELLK